MSNFKPIILAIETATSVCACALFQGSRLLTEEAVETPQRHNEILPGMVEKLFDHTGLDFHNIDLLAVSIGPGSFTGLRVGLSYAKGVATAVGVRIVPVGTLDALAWKLLEHVRQSGITPKTGDWLMPLTIARRNESFGRIFQIMFPSGFKPDGNTEGQLQAVSEPFLGGVGDILQSAVNPPRLTVFTKTEPNCQPQRVDNKKQKRYDSTTWIGGAGADMFGEDLTGSVPEQTSVFNNVKASAVETGKIGLELWQKNPDQYSDFTDLEPYYLKEFTVKVAKWQSDNVLKY